MQIIRIVTIFSLISLLNAHVALACQAVKWPFSAKISHKSISSLHVLNRTHLFDYLYFEISSAKSKRVPGLAKILFYYLINTEQNNYKYNLLLALEHAADLEMDNPNIISVNEICKIEKKITLIGAKNARGKK